SVKQGGAFDDDIIHGDILVKTAVAGGHAFDGLHHIGAFHHFTKHRITPAIGRGGRKVQEVIVGHVDEKLGGGRVRIIGARHGQRVAVVFQTVVGLVGDGLARGLLFKILVEAAALDHEVADDAMKQGAVVKAVLDVADKIFNRFGCFFGVQFDNNVASRSN